MISRNQTEKFLLMYPQYSHTPTALPPPLLRIFSPQKCNWTTPEFLKPFQRTIAMVQNHFELYLHLSTATNSHNNYLSAHCNYPHVFEYLTYYVRHDHDHIVTCSYIHIHCALQAIFTPWLGNSSEQD